VLCTPPRLRAILADNENDRLADPIRVLHCLSAFCQANKQGTKRI
jgi:hypothetical protein